MIIISCLIVNASSWLKLLKVQKDMESKFSLYSCSPSWRQLLLLVSVVGTVLRQKAQFVQLLGDRRELDRWSQGNEQGDSDGR